MAYTKLIAKTTLHARVKDLLLKIWYIIKMLHWIYMLQWRIKEFWKGVFTVSTSQMKESEGTAPSRLRSFNFKVYNLIKIQFFFLYINNSKLWLATLSCSSRLLATFNNGIITLIFIITLVHNYSMKGSWSSASLMLVATVCSCIGSGMSAKHNYVE